MIECSLRSPPRTLPRSAGAAPSARAASAAGPEGPARERWKRRASAARPAGARRPASVGSFAAGPFRQSSRRSQRARALIVQFNRVALLKQFHKQYFAVVNKTGSFAEIGKTCGSCGTMGSAFSKADSAMPRAEPGKAMSKCVRNVYSLGLFFFCATRLRYKLELR